MISWQTAAHWPYVEAPFPFYLVFYDRARTAAGGRSVTAADLARAQPAGAQWGFFSI